MTRAVLEPYAACPDSRETPLLSPRFHPDQLTQAAAAASVGDRALLLKIPPSTGLRQITPRLWPWLQPFTTSSSSISSSSRRLIRSRVTVVEAHLAEAGAAARQLRGSILQQDLVPFTFSSYTCRFLGFQYKRQGRTAGRSFPGSLCRTGSAINTAPSVLTVASTRSRLCETLVLALASNILGLK